MCVLRVTWCLPSSRHAPDGGIVARVGEAGVRHAHIREETIQTLKQKHTAVCGSRGRVTHRRDSDLGLRTVSSMDRMRQAASQAALVCVCVCVCVCEERESKREEGER